MQIESLSLQGGYESVRYVAIILPSSHSFCWKGSCFKGQLGSEIWELFSLKSIKLILQSPKVSTPEN